MQFSHLAAEDSLAAGGSPAVGGVLVEVDVLAAVVGCTPVEANPLVERVPSEITEIQ